MALGRGALGWVMCGGLAWGCASPKAKPDMPVVRQLRIAGNHELSSRQIEKRILTTKTGWWPFATAVQAEVANHREVRRSRAWVLSVAETARCQRVRCVSRRRAKANHR